MSPNNIKSDTKIPKSLRISVTEKSVQIIYTSNLQIHYIHDTPLIAYVCFSPFSQSDCFITALSGLFFTQLKFDYSFKISIQMLSAMTFFPIIMLHLWTPIHSYSERRKITKKWLLGFPGNWSFPLLLLSLYSSVQVREEHCTCWSSEEKQWQAPLNITGKTLFSSLLCFPADRICDVIFKSGCTEVALIVLKMSSLEKSVNIVTCLFGATNE